MSRNTFRGPGEDGEEEEEDSDGTESAPAPVGASEGTRGPTLAQSDQPVSHQTEPSTIGHHAANDPNYGQSSSSCIFSSFQTTSLQDSIYEGARMF
ncbi:hypothetical protein O181_124481 [Austropuccinia psidii MF-1]|uniref:Uncharacterized protein n=1 Tax=Austropuccinia psidii MF-1 TaxID=1389203 RepID=A0A9Q3Q470_9BASI|nr:hypothetical protein [Austropuccinia psidii MF-1]